MISTIGYVKSSCKDLFLIRKKLEKCLSTHAVPENQLFKYGPITYTLEQNSLLVSFKDPEPRNMFVFFQKEDETEWISFHLSNFGNANNIIQDCLKEFSDLGECYYQENDCIAEPVKFN